MGLYLFAILELNSVLRLEIRAFLNFRVMSVCDPKLQSHLSKNIYLSHDL